MSDRRIDIEDLGGLSELPPDDPRLEALESRPSARARMRAYEDFLSTTDVPPSARVAEAEARLAEALEREIGVPIGGEPATSPRPPASTPRPRDGDDRRTLLGWLGAPRLRPVFVMAALTVVLAGVWVATRPRGPGGPGGPGREDLLRGTVPQPMPGAWPGHAKSETLADGALRLRWSPAPGADRYTAVFLASDLSEIGRVSDLTATQFELHATSLPAGLASHTAVLWRVEAYQGSDEIGRSQTAPITIP